MKIKTSELIGPALDWAVAKAKEEYDHNLEPHRFLELQQTEGLFTDSTNWSQGGPIIEREYIQTKAIAAEPSYWVAGLCGSYKGPTMLIAAMRAYVASKLGDEVEIPDELT